MDYYDRLESNHRITSFLKKKKYIYIYIHLAVPGLSCATRELWSSLGRKGRFTRIVS